MKTIALLTISLVTALSIAAQDIDYRNKKDNFLKVSQKDVRADVATFAISGIVERIGKTPLKSIPATGYGTDHMSFEGEDIKVVVKTNRFDKAKHKLMFDADEKTLLRIDNKPYFGQYFAIPQYGIESVTAIIGKDTVNVPKTAFFDIYSPVFAFRNTSGGIRTNNGVFVSADKRKIYIYIQLTEAKGGSEVTWVIQDKQYLRRVVDTGIMQ